MPPRRDARSQGIWPQWAIAASTGNWNGLSYREYVDLSDERASGVANLFISSDDFMFEDEAMGDKPVHRCVTSLLKTGIPCSAHFGRPKGVSRFPKRTFGVSIRVSVPLFSIDRITEDIRTMSSSRNGIPPTPPRRGGPETSLIRTDICLGASSPKGPRRDFGSSEIYRSVRVALKLKIYGARYFIFRNLPKGDRREVVLFFSKIGMCVGGGGLFPDLPKERKKATTV